MDGTKKRWTPALQYFRDGASLDSDEEDDGGGLLEWIEDRQLELSVFMTNCKDYRHDDPDNAAYYQGLRDNACYVSQALDKLKAACEAE